VGLPDDKEIISSFWHNTGAWRTDGQMDTLLSQRPALA